MTQQKLLTLSELDAIEKMNNEAFKHDSPVHLIFKELIHTLRESIKVAQFYGNKENYSSRTITQSCGCCSFWQEPLIEEDGGIAARSFLNKIGVE